MAKTRGAAEFTLISPALTISALRTLAANLATLQTADGNVVIKCSDQLNEATLTLTEIYQENKTQCSDAPINKTKVGLTAMFKVSISDDRMSLFGYATNAKQIQAATPNNTGEPELLIMGDQAGSTSGTTTRPYITAVARPYDNGVPTTDVSKWIIFPTASVEAQATLSFGLATQRSYEVDLVAFDGLDNGLKVLRGDTTLIPV